MVQDFAKEKRSRPQSAKPPETGVPAPGWGLVLTGVFTGLLLGVFGSFLAYISGVVPPPPGSADANSGSTPVATEVDDTAQQQLTEELERAAARLQLEFYRELPNYEVQVDATPLPAMPEEEATASAGALPTDTGTPETGDAASEPVRSGTGGYLLQAGAFQQEESAQARRNELAAMGLPVRVKQEALLGRTLYLVQAGPYPDRASVAQAERRLRGNGIETMRISPGNR